MKQTHNLEGILVALMCKSREDRNHTAFLYADYIKEVRPDIEASDYRKVAYSPDAYGLADLVEVDTIRKNLQATAMMILSDEQLTTIGGATR